MVRKREQDSQKNLSNLESHDVGEGQDGFGSFVLVARLFYCSGAVKKCEKRRQKDNYTKCCSNLIYRVSLL